jgi:hypothetical protein
VRQLTRQRAILGRAEIARASGSNERLICAAARLSAPLTFGSQRCDGPAGTRRRLPITKCAKSVASFTRDEAHRAYALRGELAMPIPARICEDHAVECARAAEQKAAHVRLCGHRAMDCLQAAAQTDNPRAREVLLRLALDWLQDALTASKQSNLLKMASHAR